MGNHVARWAGNEDGARAGRLVEVVALPLALPPVSAVRAVRPAGPERVFAGAVDTWLRAGGWRLGNRGAGSVALRGGGEGEPGWLKDAWENEVRARNWPPGAVRTLLVISYDETRLYWWAADGAATH
ncbi:hypothetical protein [Pseudofrankia saprophytica]|uniref:hypothetical protein n=1 Tax=Pseudofrankia saprophytica TaxID=298655 RepID=UPI00090F7C84|nr:hypothetical protein [Pseudofrankia saprophytica]OHV32098.1 hypothetical protein BCD49_31090 [Pseudofrankia sp. EUN1h]